MEAFQAIEIGVHLSKLRKPPASGSMGKGLEGVFDSKDLCAACGCSRLTFEPPSLYCSCCNQRIKRNQVWLFCIPVLGLPCFIILNRFKIKAVSVSGLYCTFRTSQATAS